MLWLVALLPLVLALAPLHHQDETIDKVSGGQSLRSYIVVFNNAAPSFERSQEKVKSWVSQEFSHVDQNEVGWVYSVGDFRGFSIWMNENGLNELRNHKFVDYVDEDGVARIAQNDPIKDRKDWGQTRINQNPLNLATEPAGLYSNPNTYPNASASGWTWAVGVPTPWINDGHKAMIWIVDTGVMAAHQEFGGRVIRAASCINSPNLCTAALPPAGDCNGHGTHCAGSAAGQWRGVATAASIGNVVVLGCGGSGSWADVIGGFQYVADNRIGGMTNILSASLGGGLTASVNQAINAVTDSGILSVVAAGNNNGDAANYSPAGAGRPITVAATMSNDFLTSFSNWGSMVTVSAPGQSIHSAYWTSANDPTYYATLSGTSMACPLVAGAVAVYATQPQHDRPVESITQVKNQIVSDCPQVVGGRTGNKAATPPYLIFSEWRKPTD